MSSSETRFALIWLAFLAILGLVAVGTHEMGRDELHSWGVALSSSSTQELRANYDYDTHPRLWFVSLYALSRLTRSPAAMPLLSLAFSLGAAFLFLRFAPFSRPVRVLYTLGYLHLYEYGTLSRGYTQGEFFAIWLCAALPGARSRPWLVAVPLFLLAQTSLYGVFLAAGFGAALAVDLARDAGDPARRARRVIGACFAVGIACATVSLWPKPDSDDLGYKWFFALDGGRLMDAICVFAQAYLPVPNPTFHFWCSNFLDAYFPVQLAAAAALIGLSIELLKNSPRARIAFAIPAAAIVGFAYVKTAGQIRHHGHLFLAFVFALWLAADDPAARPSSGLRTPDSGLFLGALLLIHAVAGLGAVAADIAWPFSRSAELASHLRAMPLSGAELVGEPDAIVAPIAVLLERPVYFVDTDRSALFVVYRKRDGRFNAGKLAGMLRSDAGVYWITNRTLEKDPALAGDARLAGVPVHYRLLHSTGEAIRWDERYYLYQIRARDGSKEPR